MSVRVDEPDRLERYLDNYSDRNEDFRALVLRMVDELKDVSLVARLSCLNEATVYRWLAEWNKKKKTVF
jgi:DNA-binding phage protein